MLAQVGGTLTGCILSLIAWYIVEYVPQNLWISPANDTRSGRLAGVIVFYFLGMMVGGYPAQINPELTPLTMGATVTLTLLVGYELDTKRLGEAAITAMGQPYYPPYILSWRDLLAVSASHTETKTWDADMI